MLLTWIAGLTFTAQPAGGNPVVADDPPGRINLAWDDCGSFGAASKISACATNVGPPYVLVGSFVAPGGVTEFTGLSADIRLQGATPTLPEWWRHGPAWCRGTNEIHTSFDFTGGPSNCQDAFQGQATGGYIYTPGYGGPDRARMQIQCSVPYDRRGPLTPGAEYYAFRVLIDQIHTTGPGSCPGCPVPLTLTLDQIQLFQPSELANDPVLNVPDVSNVAHWSGQSAPEVQSFEPLSGTPGTPVMVFGHQFTTATSVLFGTIPAAFTVTSDSSLSTTVPLGAATDFIVVTNTQGTGVSPTQFVVINPIETEGINLSWTDCGKYGAPSQTPACASNSGAAFTMVASFTPPAGVTGLVGVEGTMDFRSDTPALPDWWRHGTGECRGTGVLSTSADFRSGPFTCDDYWQGQATGGFVYQIGYASPDRAHLTAHYGIAEGTGHELPLDREYYAFKVNITRTKTVGPGSCSGCSVPVCIVLNSIQLFQPIGAGFDPILVSPKERTFVQWGAPNNCPASTPTLASLVSADAGPGRVRLIWLTEEISSARLERREGSGPWRSLGRLTADGARHIIYEDVEVAPGATYGYRLAVEAGTREILLGETSVTIPLAANTLALVRTTGTADARTVKVSLRLPSDAAASLELFDVGGRLRASRALDGLGAGDHDVTLTASQALGPGVYFVRLGQAGEKATRRFSLSR